MPNDEQFKQEIKGMREELFKYRDDLEQVLREAVLSDEEREFAQQALDHAYALGKFHTKMKKYIDDPTVLPEKGAIRKTVLEIAFCFGNVAGVLEETDSSGGGVIHYAKGIYEDVRKRLSQKQGTEKDISGQQSIDDDYLELGFGD